jgi:hypothetical protein
MVLFLKNIDYVYNVDNDLCCYACNMMYYS